MTDTNKDPNNRDDCSRSHDLTGSKFYLVTYACRHLKTFEWVYESIALDVEPEYWLADYYGEGANKSGAYDKPILIFSREISVEMFDHFYDIQF